jgi:hypothetical protein
MTDKINNNQITLASFIRSVYEALAKKQITQQEADFLIMVIFKRKIDLKIETVVNRYISNDPVNQSFIYGKQPA